jgi:hypothetical protein
MKNRILLSLFAAFYLMACTKSDSNDASPQGNANVIDLSAVPSAVRTAFANNFSGATAVEWQRNNNQFISQFNLNSQRHDARFDDSGHQSSHSIICFDGAVPPVVLDAFRSRFPNDTVYEWKLRNDGTWRAHIMRGSIKYEATFSADGTLLKFEQSS